MIRAQKEIQNLIARVNILEIEVENLKTKLLLQVHDELVLEVPENELDLVQKQVNYLMVSVAKLRVPLEVGIGIGDNWEEAH